MIYECEGRHVHRQLHQHHRRRLRMCLLLSVVSASASPFNTNHSRQHSSLSIVSLLQLASSLFPSFLLSFISHYESYSPSDSVSDSDSDSNSLLTSHISHLTSHMIIHWWSDLLVLVLATKLSLYLVCNPHCLLRFRIQLHAFTRLYTSSSFELYFLDSCSLDSFALS